MTDAPDLTLTDAAADRIAAFLESQGETDRAIRISARKMGFKMDYDMGLAEEENPGPGDRVLQAGRVTVWVDPQSAELLSGATIDFVESIRGGGFQFDNPNAPEGPTDPVAKRVQEMLDEDINPFVAQHGGFIELIDYRDGRVFVKMHGGCQGCGQASVTLRQGVQERMRELVPEVRELIDITDHVSGENPYYQASGE